MVLNLKQALCWLGVEFHFHVNKDFIENCHSVLEGGLILRVAGCLKCFVKFALWLLSSFSIFETNTKKKSSVRSVSVLHREFVPI